MPCHWQPSPAPLHLASKSAQPTGYEQHGEMLPNSPNPETKSRHASQPMRRAKGQVARHSSNNSWTACLPFDLRRGERRARRLVVDKHAMGCHIVARPIPVYDLCSHTLDGALLRGCKCMSGTASATRRCRCSGAPGGGPPCWCHLVARMASHATPSTNLSP
jgi:hypothetical protein